MFLFLSLLIFHLVSKNFAISMAPYSLCTKIVALVTHSQASPIMKILVVNNSYTMGRSIVGLISEGIFNLTSLKICEKSLSLIISLYVQTLRNRDLALLFEYKTKLKYLL